MVARIVSIALALGILVGCYDLPKPECGFACGPASECPSDYTCNTAVNRCQLDGTTPACVPAIVDAGMDSGDDLFPPSITNRTPGPEELDVPLSAAVSVMFSEQVQVGGPTGVSTTTILLQEASGSSVSGDVTYDPIARTATLQPFSQLLPGVRYQVTVRGEIADFYSNAIGLSDVWFFTTLGDGTPPMVTSRSPGAGATNVAVGTQIVVDFSEVVTGTSTSTITVMAGGTPVTGSLLYTQSPSRATFTPGTQLAANTTYTVNVTSMIKDLSNNALVPVSWTFTTGPDGQSPIVITRTPLPASGAVPVTTQVTATFDEPVLGVSSSSFTLTPMGGSPVGATVTYAAGTRTATLVPTLQLAPNLQHTATLTTAITDAATNVLGGQLSWSFTTGPDTIGPRLVTTTPADQTTAVSTATTISVEFDEPIQNVTLSSFTVNGGAVAGTIALSAGNTVATFTPAAALPGSSTITVNLTAAITDASANAIAPVAFAFMTAP